MLTESVAVADTWNTVLLNGIFQVAAGVEFRGDDPSAALPRSGGGQGDDRQRAQRRDRALAAAQLIAVHTPAMDYYRRAAGDGKFKVRRESLNHANVVRQAGCVPHCAMSSWGSLILRGRNCTPNEMLLSSVFESRDPDLVFLDYASRLDIFVDGAGLKTVDPD